jgi:hypothetical protein
MKPGGSTEHYPFHDSSVDKLCRFKTTLRGHPEGNSVNVNKFVTHGVTLPFLVIPKMTAHAIGCFGTIITAWRDVPHRKRSFRLFQKDLCSLVIAKLLYHKLRQAIILRISSMDIPSTPSLERLRPSPR